MKTADSKSSKDDAPTATDAGVSIIANVRTRPSQTKDAAIEFRCSAKLKAAFKAKAKKEGLDMSEIFIRAMEDYIAGESLGTPARTPGGRLIRGARTAEFRRRQAEILNLLVDLRTLFATNSVSLLAPEAAMKLLTETERTSRASYNLLARHVC